MVCTAVLEKRSQLTTAVLGTVAICLALFAAAPERRSMRYALTTFTDDTGYDSKPFSFLFGFTSVTYTLTDYDGITQ